MEDEAQRIGDAQNAGLDSIGPLLRDPSVRVIAALISNPFLTEDHLCVLARRRDIPGELLGEISTRKFKTGGYAIKLQLARNPKTPRRIALSLVRGLKMPDLAALTRDKMLPTELRQLAEGIIKDKLPGLPLGVKLSLARLVSEDVLKAMLHENSEPLVRACFENPVMRESVLLWAVNHTSTPAKVIELIANHPRWSIGVYLRYALIRNRHTPVNRAMELAASMPSQDQRMLYNDPLVPVAVKVVIEIELEKKLQPLIPPAQEGRLVSIVETDEPEDDMAELERMFLAHPQSLDGVDYSTDEKDDTNNETDDIN